MTEESRDLNPAEIQRDINRGTKLLGTLSRVPDIRRIMVGRGYTEEEHQLGWRLLLGVMGWTPEADVSEEPIGPITQDQAIAELDQWDGPNFAIARAALARLHPAQGDYIFLNLTAQTGPAAVGSVKTYLDRVVALRDGSDPSREATRAKDRAAVQTLELRKVAGPELETHLYGLISEATKLAPEPVGDAAAADPAADYQQAAKDLHNWLTDWRETARAVITRRDYLIRLGLAERRSGKPDPQDTGE
jgi:hypothetical protein